MSKSSCHNLGTFFFLICWQIIKPFARWIPLQLGFVWCITMHDNFSKTPWKLELLVYKFLENLTSSLCYHDHVCLGPFYFKEAQILISMCYLIANCLFKLRQPLSALEQISSTFPDLTLLSSHLCSEICPNWRPLFKILFYIVHHVLYTKKILTVSALGG